MSHEHHHHHHHSVSADNRSMRIVLWTCISLNLLFVAVEAGVGWFCSSLSLLSHAGHNLSDVFSLLLVVVGLYLLQVHSNRHYTYGYKKGTVLVALANAILLLIAVGAIIAESVRKMREPVAVDGLAVSWTAGVGILINGLTTVLLMRATPHVTDVHHVHVWAMSTKENALTAHVVIDDEQASSAARRAIKSALRDLSITHATIEIEYGDDCPDREC